MAEPSAYFNDLFAQNRKVIEALEALRTIKDRLTQDPGLTAAYFSASNPTHRTDIVSGDITAWTTASTQLMQAYDNGAPPQKAAMFKLL